MKDILLVDDLPAALAMLEAAVHEAFANARCQRTTGVREACRAIENAQFDLALVDLALGDGHGLEVIGQLVKTQPHCAIVVSTIYDDDDNLFQALKAGAQGYLLKDRNTGWLAGQLQGIAQGQPPLSPAVARRLLRHFQDTPTLAATATKTPSVTSVALTPREREVLGLLAQGVHIADISLTLGISRHTVGDHVKNLYRKLNISSRAEAALRARGLGLI
ncbi:MAG: response regulator [Burkholderiales bacterium]|jgi:DNA-binding NarL/FixJ family response regulator